MHYRDDKFGKKTIGGLDAKLTKFPNKICARCNNARTQPHDRAWEFLSNALRTRTPKLAPGNIVRVNRIFRYDAARQMLNVHLFFVKQFGGMILEGSAPIDIKPFATAIMMNKAHACVYLKFGCGTTLAGNPLISRSDLRVDTRRNGSCAHASWIYNVEGIAVQATFAEHGMQSGYGWWHPSLGTSRLLMADMR
ncbi:MAG TPA: hypothetical protein VGU20_28250 [Stellaceae bacterium]|nr:hypothetical protein [Stellaceae bacterium]